MRPATSTETGQGSVVLDVHTHIYPPELNLDREQCLQRDEWFACLYEHPKSRLASAEDLLAEMANSGVDASAACGFGWSDHELCVQFNDYLLSVGQRYKGKILPFISVQPRAGQAAVVEIRRCAAAGAAGIGELMPDGQGFSIDDEELMRPVVHAAMDCGLPIMTHTSEPLGHIYPGKGTMWPELVYRFATRFPEMTLICAHWGGGLPFYELMPELRAALGHVYYDTAASLFLYRPEVFPAAVTASGAEKILFGTDYPLIGQRRFLRHVRQSGLDAGAIAQILGQNAARLFRIGER